MIFIFYSFLVITTQSWHIHLSFVNCLYIYRTITYNKYQQQNGTLSTPKIPPLASSNIILIILFRFQDYQPNELITIIQLETCFEVTGSIGIGCHHIGTWGDFFFEYQYAKDENSFSTSNTTDCHDSVHFPQYQRLIIDYV